MFGLLNGLYAASVARLKAHVSIRRADVWAFERMRMDKISYSPMIVSIRRADVWAFERTSEPARRPGPRFQSAGRMFGLLNTITPSAALDLKEFQSAGRMFGLLNAPKAM